jgi:transcriptional regulator with XRE-family HTH domain
MDDRRVGRLVKAARLRRGWRQADVEAASGMDQTTISLVESGRLATFTLHTIRAIADSVGAPLELSPRLLASEISQLLDQGHAALVEAVLAHLRSIGWETIAEFTFNRYGDRGSVDIVAWHAASRALLIVEVKTRLLDVQELLGTLDRKCRVVPLILARDRGWHGVSIGRLVVVAEHSAARRVVSEHAVTFASTLPQRGHEIRRWLAAPSGPLGGLWFLPGTNGVRTRGQGAGTRRRRLRRTRSA